MNRGVTQTDFHRAWVRYFLHDALHFHPKAMSKVFWVTVVIDAALFIALLVIGLTARAHPDGGHEMGLIFGVILPGLFVAVAVLLYVLSKSLPLLLIAGARLRSAWIDYQFRQDSAGADRREYHGN